VVGYLISLGSAGRIFSLGFLVVGAVNLFSFIPEYLLLRTVYYSEERLSKKEPAQRLLAKTSLFADFRRGWHTFRARPEVLVYIANSLLWFTVLVPHGMLLTAVLKSSYRLGDDTLGWFRSLGALLGILPTFFYAWLVRREGLVQSAALFIIFEAACLVGASVALSASLPILIFLTLVALSRIGLYGFTLAELEIRQERLGENIRGEVGGVCSALNYLLIIAIYLIAAVISNPEYFLFLAWLSALAVSVGAALIWRWKKGEEAAIVEADGVVR
jgi:iron-regulated transporter 1